jgi:hypothetical protein
LNLLNGCIRVRADDWFTILSSKENLKGGNARDVAPASRVLELVDIEFVKEGTRKAGFNALNIQLFASLAPASSKIDDGHCWILRGNSASTEETFYLFVVLEDDHRLRDSFSCS